jgi:predicted small secreted protein
MRTQLIFAALAVAMLASCNTARGVGQDVQAGGAAVEEAAEEVQDDLKDE